MGKPQPKFDIEIEEWNPQAGEFDIELEESDGEPVKGCTCNSCKSTSSNVYDCDECKAPICKTCLENNGTWEKTYLMDYVLCTECLK